MARVGTVIAAYATRVDRPDLPFWPMLFANITIRLLGSDDFPAAAKRQAAADLSTAAAAGALPIAIGTTVPLERIAQAHERVDAGIGERTLVCIGSWPAPRRLIRCGPANRAAAAINSSECVGRHRVAVSARACTTRPAAL